MLKVMVAISFLFAVIITVQTGFEYFSGHDWLFGAYLSEMFMLSAILLAIINQGKT